MKSRSHILALVLTALVPGCQCFVPVDDVPDGGQLDAGHDAGTDAGPPLECLDLDDCSPDASVRCWGGSTPRRSCFDNHCVLDCSGARTCTTSAGTCLTCDGGLNTCAPGCSGFQNGDVGRLYRDCGSGPTLASGPNVPSLVYRPARPAICASSAASSGRLARPSNFPSAANATWSTSMLRPIPIASVATR